MSEFADRWMLQRFGGAGQQGFYQIAYQFAAVSLIATTSILNVFWKEIAEAHVRGDSEQVALLYYRVNRGLVMIGAILSGFIIPWTKEIVTVFLGQAYLSAVPVLMVMFMYPIHQSMGQIGGTMLLASGNTRAYMMLSGTIMLISIPFSYLIQAPPNYQPIPGFGLGATGMGFKMVVVNIISVNVMAFIISRLFKWKYDWIFQVVGIVAVVGAGYIAKIPTNLIWHEIDATDKSSLIAPLVLTGAFYICLVLALLWTMPWLAGLHKSFFSNYFGKLKIFLQGL